MKYILNVYGWEGEFVCKTITHEQTEIIEQIKTDGGYNDYSHIRFNIEDHMTFDIWDGDILHKSKPLNNGTCHFELLTENNILVYKFNIDDISPNEDDVEYDVNTNETHNVYVSIDESKGGIYSCEFESDVEPTVSDFTWKEGLIFLPNKDYWSVIDSILFRGETLEPYDHLDNWGKSSTLHIFKHSEI